MQDLSGSAGNSDYVMVTPTDLGLNSNGLSVTFPFVASLKNKLLSPHAYWASSMSATFTPVPADQYLMDTDAGQVTITSQQGGVFVIRNDINVGT